MAFVYKAIINANLVTAIDIGVPLAGEQQGSVMTINNTALLIKDGYIEDIDVDINNLPAVTEVIDAKGCLLTPGFVDPHTHLVHGGSREHEIELKLKGASYMEIHKAGGGINSTVQATRKASKDQLVNKATKDLNHMLSLGVTAVDSKSGYGLALNEELKQLEVAHELARIHPMDLAHTFMGAHSVPPEYKANREAYIEHIINDMIPAVAKSGLAQFCDVFCEKGVFEVPESEKILVAAKKHGFKLKMHADEIVSIGGAELAAKLQVTSADHLMAISDKGIEDMAKSKTIAVILPGTSFYLRKDYAPARKMITQGVPVAVATDFNPGSCPSDNMQFVFNLAYLYLRMTPAEILNACTLNSAYAINMADKLGSLEKGKQADFIIWDTDNLDYLAYRFGKNHAKQVYKKGVKVAEEGRVIYDN
ncbi:imidazolonepropionase [Clostridium sp. 'deep sea']|uniref:imidazolonepropionase n=1 Tax=Clostridium sp. 'deep sea' TaxID=2779445 RepID=UPI0018968E4E|nr:imidazolonepropionase [Clostridium sp. 'deep sea']QOR36141.1 imidazolonepropionase [Clostridium sp. 'deep sea']